MTPPTLSSLAPVQSQTRRPRLPDQQGREKRKVRRMANTLETIPDALGELREGLIAKGFKEDQAFQIVLDLIRRGDSPKSLFEK